MLAHDGVRLKEDTIFQKETNMKKIIIRMIGGATLAYFVYLETGIATAIFVILSFVGSEAANNLIVKNRKFIINNIIHVDIIIDLVSKLIEVIKKHD